MGAHTWVLEGAISEWLIADQKLQPHPGNVTLPFLQLGRFCWQSQSLCL